MRVAMIGTGGIARRHLETLAAMPEVEIAGHVSRALKRASSAAKRWGGRPYTSCQELLASEEVDAAWIAVPPHAHGELETCLIAGNIPFFVEKPLSADRETADRIAAALMEKNLIAGVGYQWRAMDTIAEVRRALAHHPARMVVAAWHDATPALSWWRRQQESGGQMVEQATHLFDISRHLVGEAEVLAAAGRLRERAGFPGADVDTVSAALLAFEGGALGSFTATCLLDHAAAVQVQLICEGLIISLTRSGAIFESGRERRELRLGNDPIAEENRSFLEAVARRDPTRLYCGYQDALATHRLTFDVLDKAELARSGP